MKVHQTLAIDQVEPGMLLAVAVTDAAGHVLVPAGNALSEGVLQSLRRRDIAELVIACEADEDPLVLAARRDKITQELMHRFRKAGDGQETLALYQAIFNIRMERGA